jgi:hypothetical protein
VFDPKDFLKVASSLNKTGLSEAEYRTGISRTPYGIFLWAREELESRGEKVKAISADEASLEHSRVRQCFKHGSYKHYMVSNRLGGLYRLRYKSDYNLQDDVQREDLQQAIEYAEYIRNVFEKSLFVNPPQNS